MKLDKYKWISPKAETDESGTIRRVGDIQKDVYCRHPQHDRPLMIVLPEGRYEHTCPGCKRVEAFVIRTDYRL